MKTIQLFFKTIIVLSLVNPSVGIAQTYTIPVVVHILTDETRPVSNISEAQINNAIDLLNLDFNMLNADTINIPAVFDSIRKSANITFKLARFKPDGSPTRGIDRITTHLTINADENSKINQWDPQKYLNIWVVNSLSEPIAARGTNPLISTFISCEDGILILHDYFGSIGTGNQFTYRALTREVAIYLGMTYLWGNTIQNPGESFNCGADDGIADTPLTIGADFCPSGGMNSCNDSTNAASLAYWGFDVEDNINNFMEFSFCQRMFTSGQVTRMHEVLNDTQVGRTNLWSQNNLQTTGLLLPKDTITLGTADFFISKRTVCEGDNIILTPLDNLPNSFTHLWECTGAVPSSSTAISPVFNFPNYGYHTITHWIMNGSDTMTETKSSCVYVSGNWHEYNGPTLQDFNSVPIFWQIQNPEENSPSFAYSPSEGISQSQGVVLRNFFIHQSTDYCSDTAKYYKRLGESIDYFMSPAFDLSNTSNVQISFQYAYASNDPNPLTQTEKLIVKSSRDCGKTWTSRLTLKDTVLTCQYLSTNSDYSPSASDWKTALFNLPVTAMDTRTRFRFEFTASDYSNNLFIDNFEISGLLGVIEHNETNWSFFPNPVVQYQQVHLELTNSADVQVKLIDALGKVVQEFSEKDLQKANNSITISAAKGLYILHVSQNGHASTQRLIVE